MSATITVEEAQAKLKELIHQLAPGDEVVITENQQPVAELVERAIEAVQRDQVQGWEGHAFRTWLLTSIEPLEEMKEYTGMKLAARHAHVLVAHRAAARI